MLRRCAGRIYIALIISGFFVYTHQWTLFERCTCNDGSSCHPDDLVFEARYKNFTGCAAHCRRSADCFELFYDPLQFFCFGCNMIRGPVLGINTGLKYYQRRVCPPPRNTFFAGRSCYLIGPVSLNFSNAMDYCSEYGRYILQLETQEENQMMFEMLSIESSASTVWLGTSDIRKPGTWVWESSGAALEFNFWNPIEPTGQPSVHCGAFVHGPTSWAWEKMDCSFTGDALTICETGMLE